MAKKSTEKPNDDSAAKPNQDTKSRKDYLKTVRRQFTKEFGEDTIHFGNEILFKGESISTGSILIDQALGNNGIPLGKIVEIFGAESSGKTTLCSSIIANAQKAGYYCAFIDAEATYDKDWAERIGVNMDELLVAEPDTFEQSLDMVSKFIDAGFKLIVYDSYAASPALSEVEGDSGDRNIAEKARILSQYLRKITQKLNKANCTLIFINQIRTNVGQMYGNPETTPGGKALHHGASIRMRISKQPIREKNEIIGDTVRVNVKKNKAARPGRVAETTLLFDRGFDITYEIVRLAVELELIERAGAWYKPVFLVTHNGMNEEEIGKYQGMDSLVEWVVENEYLQQLDELVRAELNSFIVEEPDIDDDEGAMLDDSTL